MNQTNPYKARGTNSPKEAGGPRPAREEAEANKEDESTRGSPPAHRMRRREKQKSLFLRVRGRQAALLEPVSSPFFKRKQENGDPRQRPPLIGTYSTLLFIF